MIRDIILNQKLEFERKLTEKYVERELQVKNLDSGLINVVIGPRRAGKSFFCMHLVSSSTSYAYVNFDDERLIALSDFDELMQVILSVYTNPVIFLFDEIQNVPKWELIVNRMQRQGYKMIVTGSNSNLLSNELSTHLTGRHLANYLLPFSFREIIALSDKELTVQEKKQKCLEYVNSGGYPEPLVKDISLKDYLNVLFDSILFKDIVKRHKIRYSAALEDLGLYLVSNLASEISYTALAKSTQVKSAHTVEKYLGYMEDAFLFFKIGRFSYKVREQISSNKKVYCFDNGYYLAKAFKFSPDTGKLFENTVAVELKKMELNREIRLFYWKNTEQEEVDFVIQKGTVVDMLIQVCFSVDEKTTANRETRALLKAGRALDCRNLLVITANYEAKISMNWFGINGEIEYKPLWKWLIEQK